MRRRPARRIADEPSIDPYGCRMPRLALALAALLALAPLAGGQHTRFTLSEEGQWSVAGAPTDPDEALLAEAQQLIHEGRPGKARAMLSDWIRENNFTDNPWLPAALRLRGDAKTAGGNEWKALYDYELVTESFPASPEYITAIEREFEIAQRYLRGMRRKLFGLRFVGAKPTGVEIMIRVVERIPQSNLAQQAFRELAEHFLRERDLASAALVGQKFEEHYAAGASAGLVGRRFEEFYATGAMTRDMLLLRITTNLARFKGPRYNGAALIETRALAERYREEYPTDEHRATIEAILVRVDNSAGQHMLEKAEWYLRVGDPSSAQFTLRRLLRRHPQTAAADEALRIMDDRGWIADDEPDGAEGAS